jgi:hypothetical protein
VHAVLAMRGPPNRRFVQLQWAEPEDDQDTTEWEYADLLGVDGVRSNARNVHCASNRPSNERHNERRDRGALSSALPNGRQGWRRLGARCSSSSRVSLLTCLVPSAFISSFSRMSRGNFAVVQCSVVLELGAT